MRLSCKIDPGTLLRVLTACPQSLQMYIWRYIKELEVVLELLRAICNSQGHIIQFLKEGECPVWKQKMSLYEATEWS